VGGGVGAAEGSLTGQAGHTVEAAEDWFAGAAAIIGGETKASAGSGMSGSWRTSFKSM